MKKTTPTSQPVPFTPAVEKSEADEAETTEEMLETLRKIRERTYEDGGHAMRSVHVKSHAILKGELQVLDNLPSTLKQGLFAEAASYPLLMRLSATPGDMLPDKISTPRGLALKIVGVEGERLEGAEDTVTQNFLMVNGEPAFQVDSLKNFLMNMKLLAATTDRGVKAKEILSSVMKGTEKAVEAVGMTSSKIKNMGGEPEKHPLGETFFSQAPIRFGDYIAKLSLVPVSQELTSLKNMPLEPGDNPLAIREAMLEYFQATGGAWELRAQLCTDLETMPVEDASVEWPQEESPYIAVAKIVIPPQTAWSEARSKAVDDGMFFSPWQGLAAHRPLGSLARARKPAYEISAKFRSMRNDTPVVEPKTLENFPD